MIPFFMTTNANILLAFSRPFFVGDNLPTEFVAGRLNSVTLRLWVPSISTADHIEVRLNGVALPNAGCE